MEIVEDNLTGGRAFLKAVSRVGGYEILAALANGPLRFTKIQDIADVSPRTLSGRLKEMIACDMLVRTVYAEVPPKVEYKLTETGLRVFELISELNLD